LWHRQRTLLPDEVKALLALEAPDNEAIARDLWVNTEWWFADLIRADVNCLHVSEDEGVLDTVYLAVTRMPRRRPGVPMLNTATLSPDVVERLVPLLERRHVTADDPLLVDRRGRRYSSETFIETMTHIAEQARISGMPGRILSGQESQHDSERTRAWRLPSQDALKRRTAALLRRASENRSSDAKSVESSAAPPREEPPKRTEASSSSAPIDQPATWHPVWKVLAERRAQANAKPENTAPADDQRRVTITITASCTLLAELMNFVLRHADDIDIQVRKSPSADISR